MTCNDKSEASSALEARDGNTTAAEECQPIQTANTWFWNSTDGGTIMSAASIIAEAARVNAAGATYLLDCPPDTTGQIPALTVSTLTTVGLSR
jgi:alpha-L-fucosidase